MSKPRTIIEKLWDSHVVSEQPGAPALLYIDLHLVHEVTSPQAFAGLRERGLKVRRPDLTIATVDHSIPTTTASLPIVDKIAATQVAQLEANCKEFGIPCYGIHSEKQGIVHVIGPELRLHAARHDGGLRRQPHGDARRVRRAGVRHRHQRSGARAGDAVPAAAQVEDLSGAGGRHAAATGVTAKDIILTLISRIGIGGGTGCVFEYCGSAIRALSMEERMTVCNMSIEGGARAGLVAPDDTTFEYPERPSRCAEGRGLGRRGRALEAASDRRRRDLRPDDHHRRRRDSSR